MKATHRLRPSFVAVAALTILLTGSCAERRIIPAPAPAPMPTPKPVPTSVPRTQIDWRDAPITPGEWRWALEGGQSVARFAGNTLLLSCDATKRTITLSRAGAARGEVPLTVITQSVTRPLMGTPRQGSPPSIAVTFSATDSLLDAMAFSRGRFAVETAGLPTLYVPTWPEVSRVIEDCR
jgi:hypothetical protein